MMKNEKQMKYFKYSDDDQIFKFLKPLDNTKLSDLKREDLQELLNLLEQYYLIYRKKICISKNITFGFEIEIEHVDDKLEEYLEEELYDLFVIGNWESTSDNSLEDGLEICTPVLTDTKINWKELKRVCSFVNNYSIIGKKSGGHIHIGSQIIGSKKRCWLNLLNLWSVYENILFRFLYGEYLNGRRSISWYANIVSDQFNDLYTSLSKNNSVEEIIRTLKNNVDRSSAINFGHVDIDSLNQYIKSNTIEFRVPNGSLNPIVWQNNLNVLVHLLLYTKSNGFDQDIVEKRKRINKEFGSSLEMYNEIYLEQALELADLIFDNNYDKVYFLKQYLKSFDILDNTVDYKKAKAITR